MVEKVRLLQPMMAPEAIAATATALRSSWIGCGPRAAEFETEIQQYLHLPLAPIATTSGTAALEIAIETLLTPGDLVISTPISFVATQTALARAGMRIVFADVDPRTGLIDIESVHRLLGVYGERVQGVVAVDWCGLRASTVALRRVATRQRIILDAAQSFGSRSALVPAELPDAVCWSFQATKHVTTVDGGAVYIKDSRSAELARARAYFGLDVDQGVPPEQRTVRGDLGAKRHLDDVRATIGRENLRYARDWQERRKAIVERYPTRPERLFPGGSVFWVYPAFVPDLDEARRAFRDEGIEVSQIHLRNDWHRGLHPYVENLSDPRPGVDEYRKHFLALPCGPWLSDEEAERVARVLGSVGR